MARIIDPTKVAIIYETITGQCQLRGSVTTDAIEDIDAWVARHPGLEAIIIDRSSLPGSDNETFFRQTIATATSTSFFAKNADRAVQVGPAAITPVISVHHGHIAGLDQADTGHTLVPHAFAEVGDTYVHSNGSVTRRYAVVNPATGLVDQISNLAVGPSVPLPPIPGDILVPSLTLQVGNIVSIEAG